VGCVVVHNERIIGEGYHHKFGGPHAEVNAIRSVKDPSLFPESTLYCNLEPCAHHGKTPPCSTLIMQKRIGRVVISNLDPFPSVDGQGISMMSESGIQVVKGCLANEGTHLNRRFFVFHRKRRPYVILKWAQTLDGFIDLERAQDEPVDTHWISNELSRTLVHKWRSEEAAIMVGTQTVITDNPRLNIRKWTGTNPLRITIDRHGRLSENHHIMDGKQDTLVFTGSPGKYSGRTKSIHVDHSYELRDLLEELYDQRVISVFVEGGARMHESFLKDGLWDEARVFTGKMRFNKGVHAPELLQKPDETTFFGDTKLECYLNKDHRIDV